MPTHRTQAATIDITSDSMDDGGPIIPNGVRINGVPVLVPAAEGSIVVHDPNPGEAVRVTVTMYARRVTISADDR